MLFGVKVPVPLLVQTPVFAPPETLAFKAALFTDEHIVLFGPASTTGAGEIVKVNCDETSLQFNGIGVDVVKVKITKPFAISAGLGL